MREREQKFRIEKPRSPETIGKGIVEISVVVPSLDEKTNILSLRDNLRIQRRALSPNISLRLVISDNGSANETLNIYQQIINDEKSQREEKKLDIVIVYGSKKGFHSAARNEGLREAIKTFHGRNPQTPSQDHLIVNFDADTVFEKENALQILSQDVFADPNTMVAFGPIKFISSIGKISSDYQFVQRPFTRILLNHLFRLNGKHIQDYINLPHEIFHSIFTGMRESALVDKDNPNNLLIKYNPTDRAGVDVRMSLILQRYLQKTHIVFDKRLAVLTSARGYETKRGNISRLKFMKKTFNLFFGTHYVPYALQREIDTLPEKERETITSNLRFADVIGSFTKDVDREVYGLGKNEYVLYSSISSRKAQKRQLKGDQVVPAKNLKTGELIPQRFTTVIYEEKQGK